MTKLNKMSLGLSQGITLNDNTRTLSLDKVKNAILDVDAVKLVKRDNKRIDEDINFKDLIGLSGLTIIDVVAILNRIAISNQDYSIDNYQIKVITLPKFIARLVQNLSITEKEAQKVLTEFKRIFK